MFDVVGCIQVLLVAIAFRSHTLTWTATYNSGIWNDGFVMGNGITRNIVRTGGIKRICDRINSMELFTHCLIYGTLHMFYAGRFEIIQNNKLRIGIPYSHSSLDTRHAMWCDNTSPAIIVETQRMGVDDYDGRTYIYSCPPHAGQYSTDTDHFVSIGWAAHDVQHNRNAIT